MKGKIILSMLMLVMLQTSGNGQELAQDFRYSVSYFGNNIWNEGLNFGLDKIRYSYPKTNKKGKEKTITKSHLINIGFFNDSNSHLGAFAVAGWGSKIVFKNRFNLTSAVQPFGLFRSFLPETYKVKSNGEINKVFLPGRLYLCPSISAGFGRIGKKNPDNGWFTKLNMMVLLPYNKAILPLLNVEFGYHFTIKSDTK